MTASKPLYLAQMRLMVADLEEELGLSEMTESSRLLYCAAVDIANKAGTNELRTGELMNHALMRNVARPTFFRSMADLLNRHLITRSASSKRGVVALVR